MKHYGDITKIDGAKVEAVDIITGGSPCQDLSVAGKRAGLAGERSGLFMEQIRVIKEMRENERRNGRTDDDVRPRFMVWENVPGALSSGTPRGEDFRIVLEETARVSDPAAVIPRPANGKWTNAGCIMLASGGSIAWRIHDAQFWGVPQRRRRIALVADFSGGAAPEILFERESVSGDLEPSGAPGQGTAEGIVRSAGEPSANSFQERAGKAGGGKGILIQKDRTGALSTLTSQAVYGIGSYDSNAMKSGNPSSGVYEAETARTLDNNGGCPACNQGGMAIIEGNGARESHRGNGYAVSDTMFTLNTVECHAVCESGGGRDTRHVCE